MWGGAQVVQLWRKDLAKINPKAAESLADPGPYPNLFPNLDWALQAERLQARTSPGAAGRQPCHCLSALL